MTTPTYLLGLDLGRRRDFTALSVLRVRAVPSGRVTQAEVGFSLESGTITRAVPVLHYRYELIHLDRWRDRSYLDVVPEVRAVMSALQTHASRAMLQEQGYAASPVLQSTLLVDQTGVGQAVVDQIRGAGLDCTGITITGGTSVSLDGRDVRVPKRELVGAMEVVVETHRLSTPPEAQLPMVGTLIAEMDNFRAATKLETGHDTYGAADDWREGNHDDLVLSVAMAVWYGEHQAERSARIQTPTGALAAYLDMQ